MMPANVADSYLAKIPIILPDHGLTIRFYGNPTCEATSEYANGGSQEKVTLNFTSSQYIADKTQLAYVVTDINGQHYVIGSREKPFPTISRTQNTGAPDSDAAVFSYEITHVAIKSLVPCVI